jgi:hypothetical protein
MTINERVSELLCEKAELLRDSVKATNPAVRAILSEAMASIDRTVDMLRKRQAENERRAAMVVVRWTRKVA